MKALHIQVGITILAVIVIVIHVIWPTLAVDSITLALIILAILPWIAPLFKSLEFPGGWKIEFQELQKAENKADKAGLLAPASTIDITPKYSFQVIADNDPNLALAGLRIEIEKRLQSIAESKNISVKNQGVSSLMRILSKEGALSQQEYSVLSDMVGMLNSAVHGATVDKRAVEWAMETGPRLLKSLDDKRSVSA
jgi:hypothetical protein